MANKESEKLRIFRDFQADFGSLIDLSLRIERRKTESHRSCGERSRCLVRKRRAVKSGADGNPLFTQRLGKRLRREYAGGIMSSAIDGIKCANKLAFSLLDS